MKKASAKLLTTLFCLLLMASLHAADEPKLSPLTSPRSPECTRLPFPVNGKKTEFFSFMGIGPKKTWDAISTSAYEMEPDGKWEEKRAVPGIAGRLAASAVALHDQIFIFGGYVVDSQGGETSVPDLDVFVPGENRYYRGKDIPVPVDDAVVGVYRDRYIFLIGGWSSEADGSKGAAVRNVQIYDTEKDTWDDRARPFPALPSSVTLALAIAGDTIVYVDGAYKNPFGANPKYIASSECWMGYLPESKKADVSEIEWIKLPPHPGKARYRIAAGTGPAEKRRGKIYFSGGTDNPYNYDGIGYNGHPSEPSPVTFAFNVATEKWETINEDTPDPTMDHRGLLVTRRGLVMVGGMEKGQQVTAKVTVVKLGRGK